MGGDGGGPVKTLLAVAVFILPVLFYLAIRILSRAIYGAKENEVVDRGRRSGLLARLPGAASS
jgi:hypothetical protein